MKSAHPFRLAFGRSAVLAVALAVVIAPSLRAAGTLAAGFANRPASTKPWCYWYWTSDNTSREGITRDREAMARVGIGEALVGNIYLDNQPAGKTKVLSEEWWDLVRHAMREAGLPQRRRHR